MLRTAVVLAALALAAATGAGAATRVTVQPVGVTDGQTVSGRVHVEAAGDAQRVEYSVDGRLRTVARNAPFGFDWDTTLEQNGVHTLDLWTVGRDGSVATAHLTVVVANTFAASLPGLAEGERVSGQVGLAPQVDGLGAQWIELLVDGELRWTLDRTPYVVNWNTALETAGPHTVSVWAVAVGGAVSQIDVHVVVRAGQTANAARFSRRP